MSPLGPETTTIEVTRGIDLAGRRAVVTGASGGLGAETARALAAAGAEVVLACRDVGKGERVAAGIRASLEDKEPALDVAALDLLSAESIRGFAAGFLESGRPLHLLLNNAGVMACDFHRTPEGRELQFATNHLGHFLLTGLLAPALRSGAPARVVNTTSSGHRLSPVVLDDVDYERRDYDKWEAYGQAKTANVLHALELDRRLAPEVRAFAVHPGMIMTELGRHLTEQDVKELMDRASGTQLSWKTVEAGAATQVWAATSPDLDGRGGLYLEDCAVAEPSADATRPGGYMPWALDAKAAAALWELSETLVGESFPL